MTAIATLHISPSTTPPRPPSQVLRLRLMSNLNVAPLGPRRKRMTWAATLRPGRSQGSQGRLQKDTKTLNAKCGSTAALLWKKSSHLRSRVAVYEPGGCAGDFCGLSFGALDAWNMASSALSKPSKSKVPLTWGLRVPEACCI